MDSENESDTSADTVVAGPSQPRDEKRWKAGPSRLKRSFSMTPFYHSDLIELQSRCLTRPIWTDRMKRVARMNDDHIFLESDDFSIYRIPFSNTVEESFQYTYGVDTAARNMLLASSVVPVYPPLHWGRSFHKPMSYISSADWQFHSLLALVDRFGEIVFDIIWPQLVQIVRRLQSIGLWHSALEGDLIMIDNRWNIRNIAGWIFCTEIRDPKRCDIAQLQQLYSRNIPLGARKRTDEVSLVTSLRNGTSLVALDLAIETHSFQTVSAFHLRESGSSAHFDADGSRKTLESIHLPDFSYVGTRRIVILCGKKCEYICQSDSRSRLLILFSWISEKSDKGVSERFHTGNISCFGYYRRRTF